jgi:hypothetical protein
MRHRRNHEWAEVWADEWAEGEGEYGFKFVRGGRVKRKVGGWVGGGRGSR